MSDAFLNIVKLVGDDRASELRDAVHAAMAAKVNQMVDTRKSELTATMLTKENYDQGKNGYVGNTPDEKSIIAKLMKNVTKHDYPVENKDELPFKALSTHPVGPEGDHAPADPIKVP